MNDLLEFLDGNINFGTDNVLLKMDKYYHLKLQYADVINEITIKELELDAKQYELIQSDEYKDLKITEKKDKAKNATIQDQKQILKLYHMKDKLKAQLEVLNLFFRLANKGE